LPTCRRAASRAASASSGRPAGFDIGETLIPYDALDPYWRAFAVGIVNTIRVALIGIVLATVMGALLGIGRFSRNAIVRGMCYGYVELFRNRAAHRPRHLHRRLHRRDRARRHPLAVSHGQWEAPEALGLRTASVLRLVVLPQALRVIIPPMTSQYLNLTKNSRWRSRSATRTSCRSPTRR
jgi:ABC-type amino acid transport system permease subunit